MREVQLELLSERPFRFGLLTEDGERLSIGERTRKAYSLSTRLPLPVTDELALIAYEQNRLKEELFQYCAGAERSPFRVREWLKKRLLNEKWFDFYYQMACDGKWLNPERFARVHIEKRMRKGSLPRMVIEKELYHHRVDKEVYTSVFEELNYNEANCLRAFLRKSRSFQALSPQAVIDKLQMRGFSFAVIQAALKTKND